MLTSIRARVICVFVALVVFSVVVSTAANYLIARNSMWDATDNSLSTSLNDHARVIGDWVAEKTRLVDSLQDVVLTDSPDAMLKQIQVAGGFFDVGVGYPTRRPSSPTGPIFPLPMTRPPVPGTRGPLRPGSRRPFRISVPARPCWWRWPFP